MGLKCEAFQRRRLTSRVGVAEFFNRNISVTRADTEQQKRSPDALVGAERMLGCDGIRIGAYDSVSSRRARGACHISSRKKFVQKGYNYITFRNLVGGERRLMYFFVLRKTIPQISLFSMC